jgi:outer membrane scaffolding protein for murein synthesis (MipA/OmpV family)
MLFMRLALSLVVLAGVPGLAFAGSGTGSDTPPWTIDIGVASILAPAFPGGKTYRYTVLPSVSVAYKDLVFASFEDGIGVNILRWNGLTAGPVITFEPSRSYSDDRLALRGLTDVPFTIAAGGFVNYDFGVFAAAKLEVSKSLNGNNGLVANASFTLNAPPLLNNTLFLSAGPEFQWVDGNYARAYFGVSELNARQSIYPEFEPSSGLSYGVSADAEYLLTDKVSLNVFGEASAYGGGIAKSSILTGEYGTRVQYTLGATLTYRFAF